MGATGWQERPLGLGDLRGELVRQEVTILFAFIERAQFARNAAMYAPGGVAVEGFEGSFFDYMLRETERLHALAGRYAHCEEHPFTPDLPAPLVNAERYTAIVRPSGINANDLLRAGYFEQIVPALCADTDDGDYGSSATCDIQCLQALSRRIHYGEHIAEAKFQADREGYTERIRAGDAAGIEALLVDKDVERAVLARVREKAALYGAEPGLDGQCRVSPDVAAECFERFLIPRTIAVEVDYLLARLDEPSVAR